MTYAKNTAVSAEKSKAENETRKLIAKLRKHAAKLAGAKP